jgi:hypothetical protein
MNSQTFCVNPWITLHTKNKDSFNPCCLFKGQMNYSTVAEYANSRELASVKQKLLDGESIQECSACWKQEQTGYVSKRQRDNKTYKNIFQSLNQDLSKPQEMFVEYYLRLGNHCNLKCTSCNDSLSSGWISENKKFNIATTSVTLLPDDHDVWLYIKNNANTIAAIEFIGGEPFMMSIDLQTNLLKCLVDNQHAKHIRLKYNTNGTRLPIEQLEFWSSFKAIELNISIDGIGDRFDYLRCPAEWSTVDHNIRYYQELQKNIPQLELCVISTISTLSIGYIQEILDYCHDNKLNIFLNLLESPAVLNIYLIDSAVKSWIVDRVKNIDHPVIKNILTALHQQPSSVHSSVLLEFLTTLDARRGLDVKQTFPELAECLQQCSDTKE